MGGDRQHAGGPERQSLRRMARATRVRDPQRSSLQLEQVRGRDDEDLPPPRPSMKVLHLGKFYPPAKGGMEAMVQLICRETSRLVQNEVIVANNRFAGAAEFDG